MERIPSQPPKIAPLLESIIRPLWSVMIPVYNCSQFIPDALESVLSQDPGEDQMQIEVVDDGSTDTDVEELVNSIGKGRVKYFRQPKNVGSLRNFETCINRAKGHLVHLLHGDDRVKDGFYEKFSKVFKEFPNVAAVFCRYSIIDEYGNKLNEACLVQNYIGLVEGGYLKMAAGLHIQFVTMVVKREVYEKLGSFYGVIAGEDWEMWTRIAKNYPIAYLPENLADYRKYFGTISWPIVENGRKAKDLAKTTLLIESRLSKTEKVVMKKTKKIRAHSCISTGKYILNQSQNIKLINELVKMALVLERASPRLYGRIFKLYFNIFKYKIKYSFNNKLLAE